MGKSKSRRLLFATMALTVTAVATETVLQAAWWLSPTVQFHLSLPGTVTTIPDDQLGWRGHPGHPEHDRHGFRNRSVPDRADIVAMGDSQTYGYHVQPHESWPRQLAPLHGVSSYVMAYGGYGPVHSLLLWDEAMRLKPKVVIEAMYSGNDLYEAFRLVYDQNQAPWLKSSQLEIQQAIQEAQGNQTLHDRISRVYWMGNPPTPWQPAGSVLRRFVSQHCRLYGLLRAVKNASWLAVTGPSTQPLVETDWQANKQYAAKHKDYCIAFEHGAVKTVMNPACRSESMNLDDPRIAEGHRIAIRANRLIAQRAREANIRYLVVLIPTKDLVFKDVVRDSGFAMPAAYDQMIQREEAMWRATKRHFERHKIETIDTLDALRKRLAEGQQPFHMSLDTHLNLEGHRVVAQLVHAYLSQTRHHTSLASKR